MRSEGPGDSAIIVAVAAPVQRARLDLGRQVAFLEREQASGVEDDVGVGHPAIRAGGCGSIGQFSTAEARKQRAAGVVFGLPFWSANPAVAVTGAAVLEMEGVQHAVSEEP